MDSLLHRLAHLLWSTATPASRAGRVLQTMSRYGFALIRDLATGDVSLRAMSLVYTTMLATVPLLGFAFALAKVLGFHRQLEPMLLRALEPIGPRATEITASITGFADNINGGVLGTLSFGLLLLTVISMAQKVESSFNFVWRVDRPRSFLRRFSEYLSVILIGPLFMLVAITLIAGLSSTTLVTRLQELRPFGSWIAHIGDVVPYLMLIAAFTFLNVFIPNTRVRLRPALIGGTAGGLAWAASGYLFTNLVVSSARMESIYSGFAIVLILMFWLYISWLVLLLGSQLAFYAQNPFHLRHGRRTAPIDNDARERLCLAIMYLVASDFARPSHGWSNEGLAAALRVPREAIEPILGALDHGGLIVRASEQRLIPGRDPHRIPLSEIIAAVRGQEQGSGDRSARWNAAVDPIADRIGAAIAAELQGRTLGELVDANLDAR
jgi:membrane protein